MAWQLPCGSPRKDGPSPSSRAKRRRAARSRREELTLPGFRHDLCAMNLSMFAGSGFFRRAQGGAAGSGPWLRRSREIVSRPSFATERISASAQRSTKTLGWHRRSFAGRCQGWRDLLARFGVDAPHIFALLGSPMPSISAAKVVWKAWRQRGTAWLLETLRLFLASPGIFSTRGSRTPRSRR